MVPASMELVIRRAMYAVETAISMPLIQLPCAADAKVQALFTTKCLKKATGAEAATDQAGPGELIVKGTPPGSLFE
jgi:hypothetical protein